MHQLLGSHIPNAVYEEIETAFGHDAFLIELDQVRNAIRKNVAL